MPPTPTKKSDEQRICRKHGLTAFVHEPSKAGTGYRCRLCRVEAITTKRRALKQRLADHLGGSCSDCGYNRCIEALHFHHVDGKDATISSMIGAYQAKAVWKEVERCVLLCANCHAERHSQTMQRTGIEPVHSVFQTDTLPD